MMKGLRLQNRSSLQFAARILLAALLFITSIAPAQFSNKPASAYEVFYMLYDQALTYKEEPLYVYGNDETPVTYGAEKEGSSKKILRVMSPDVNIFRQFLVEYRDRDFVKDFITEFLNGKHQVPQVVNAAGETISLNKPSEYVLNKNYNTIQKRHREKYVVEFAQMFPDSPFSFLDPTMREKFYDFATQVNAKKGAHLNIGLLNYEYWTPLFGEAERYIDSGTIEGKKSWEILFKPQKTFAEFEKMQDWFRKIMGTGAKLFEAPGHQRVVMPLVELKSVKDESIYEGKAAEVSRMLEAYIVLRGIRGNTGVIGAKHKDIQEDYFLEGLNTERGPLRLERNRFYGRSIGVEFRAGMKDEVVRRFTQAIYAARLATNDMNDIYSIHDYPLIDMEFSDYSMSQNSLDKLAERFNVTREQVYAAILKFTKVRKSINHDHLRSLQMIPLWYWEKAPFLKGKSEDLRRITRQWILSMAALQSPTYEEVHALLRQWASSADLTRDIEHYLIPKKQLDKKSSPLTVEIPKDGIDVNKIDLGNEFTARMPLKLKANYDNDGKWVSTIYDMTPESREKKIKSLAESLKKNLTGSKTGVTKLTEGSHGHAHVIAYTFKDSQDRSWRLEWDGVSRNYDTDGNLVEKSVRGGHIEIVSPKYTPTMEEIRAVYDAMEKESVIPEYKAGGSHINVDYTLFEKNPEALARFLTLFHEHRGIIAFMFQHVNRLRAAEPVVVSENLDKALRDFRGSKKELATLLYNEGYFNQRFNRKTRYTQIDMSNFMGDVIPEKFKLPDFDVVKARFTGGKGWEHQFRVNEMTKMEMRLFDAAKDSVEAAFQIKLVRALMNVALNEKAPLTRPVQNVDYEHYVKNPNEAYQALDNLVKDLNLNVDDYRPYLLNKFVITKAAMASPYYRNWNSYADKDYPKQKGWGKATAPSSNRKTSPPPAPAIDGGARVRCEAVF